MKTDTNKSLDNSETIVIESLLCDIQTLHSEVLTPRALRLTVAKLRSRIAREGLGFVTKTLPRLGKALDKCLTGVDIIDSAKLGFKPQPGSKLPKFLGELFNCVCSNDGRVLQVPCVTSIKSIREICFCMYKLKLPYSVDDEAKVLDNFRKVEVEILHYDDLFTHVSKLIDSNPSGYEDLTPRASRIIRRARMYLSKVFQSFDPMEISPRHGPGVVSTKERLWDKYRWTSIPHRLSQTYPIDAYFYASQGHVCDSQQEIFSLADWEDSARVLLVPKDSRGPRLISAEPLVFQWIQQGLSRAIVRHVERHPLTRDNVHFTNQQPNQFGALLGSETGRYATLDLKDASDRVTCGLVRLLFPEPLLECLMATRSLSTVLPSGEKLVLRKFAPMGSALCFPIMALTIWSLLRAGMDDAYSRKRILVYGDDVIVPTAQAANAINILESFGLAINREKSCTSGSFRESCGVDAFSGIDVTPVRFRTRWSSSRSPEAFMAWVDYSNSCYERGYSRTASLIASWLVQLYGPIPRKELGLTCPSLYVVPEFARELQKRVNSDLQKLEYRVLDCVSKPIRKRIKGWSMLLRYFAEHEAGLYAHRDSDATDVAAAVSRPPSSVYAYTKRHSSILVWCWR